MKQRQNILQSVNEADKIKIIDLYVNQNQTIKECSHKLHLPSHWVRTILFKNGITLKTYSDYKRLPNAEEEKQILDWYNQKRGIQYISDKLKIGWETIKETLNKNNVVLWNRSELIKSNEQFYGRSKKFTFQGHKHSSKSKKKTSNSLKGNANRTITGSKSQFILTTIGKVQGSYEVAYLQSLINKGFDLPKICGKVQTPYGLYFPDFEYDDRFIEVKSKFTWDVCSGIEPNPKGIKTDIQRKKINWTTKNVKPVEVVIIKTKEALDLFREAIKNEKLVIEKVIYKNGKYYKAGSVLSA